MLTLRTKLKIIVFLTFLPHNPDLKRPEVKSLLKTWWEREKMLVTAFSPFPTMFSILSKIKIIVLADFILLSANTFNLDQSRILSSCKELKG